MMLLSVVVVGGCTAVPVAAADGTDGSAAKAFRQRHLRVPAWQAGQGPAVIIGDAAHVVTPMTGAGLVNGFRDVLALTGELAHADSPADVPAALRRYERIRLGPARDLAPAPHRGPA